jgi:protocatechuate 3,4-dioxygenase alpha subunit
VTLRATTSQTVGPFFRIGCRWLHQDNLAGEGIAGERVTIYGRVLDGDGIPVPDAMLEVWQANSYGKYAHPEDTQDKPLERAFTGFGRVAVDLEGAFRFTTIKPGPVPGPDGKDQAPHLAISLFMRGLLKRLTTRMYFPNDGRNASDAILNMVDPARRSSLIAKSVLMSGRAGQLEWNVILQGTHETVFFDLGL